MGWAWSSRSESKRVELPLRVATTEVITDENIIYRPLTFETTIPHMELISLFNDGQALPDTPNLKRLTSPLAWSTSKKNFMMCISCIATTLCAYAGGSYGPGVDQIMHEWNITFTVSMLGLTTFTLGFGIAPMVLAPFSEFHGRKPVFIASGFLLALGQVCCAISKSYAGMLISRFLVGVGGSTFSTMVGGVVNDIYSESERNTAMAIFCGSALFGTAAGPFICGFIAQSLSWQWIFYTQAIANGLIAVAIALFFRETRSIVLLITKARALNLWYESCEKAGYYDEEIVRDFNERGLRTPARLRWRVESQERRPSLAKTMLISLYRPLMLLVRESVVFWFSLWVGFAWAVMYLTIAAVPLVFQTAYGFDLAQSNAVFAAAMIGCVTGPVMCIYQERLVNKWTTQRQPTTSDHIMIRTFAKKATSPERRLFFSCWASGFMVIGFFIFGWGASLGWHWVIPVVAVGIANVGIFSVYLAAFNYLADTYYEYASSAIAAQSFCRNMLAGAFPLFTRTMYTNLGYGQASTVLGGVGAFLMVVPWILIVFGRTIREKSVFASTQARGASSSS